MTQSGARGVAVSTQRAAQPYEFAYDHVSGELGSQDDLFMCKHMLCAAQTGCSSVVHAPGFLPAVGWWMQVHCRDCLTCV